MRGWISCSILQGTLNNEKRKVDISIANEGQTSDCVQISGVIAAEIGTVRDIFMNNGPFGCEFCHLISLKTSSFGLNDDVVGINGIRGGEAERFNHWVSWIESIPVDGDS